MRHHLCQSVEGALKNWGVREWKSIARENGLSIAECQSVFRQYLREGIRVIPIGDECEGFNYQTGCPGHKEVKDERKETQT